MRYPRQRRACDKQDIDEYMHITAKEYSTSHYYCYCYICIKLRYTSFLHNQSNPLHIHYSTFNTSVHLPLALHIPTSQSELQPPTLRLLLFPSLLLPLLLLLLLLPLLLQRRSTRLPLIRLLSHS